MLNSLPDSFVSRNLGSDSDIACRIATFEMKLPASLQLERLRDSSFTTLARAMKRP